MSVQHNLRKHRDEQWLREKYHGEGLSCTEIAEQCDVVSQTIHRNLRKNDIETRSEGTSNFGKEKYHDLQWLQKKYHDEDLSYSEIADICGVSKQTIYNSAKKVGLDTEGDTRYKNKSWFKRKHHEEEIPLYKIAEMCDVSRSHIIEWRKHHGIETHTPKGESSPHSKPPEECVKRKRGPNWCKQRRKALERADYACENPNCNEDSNSLGQNPDVHHIVPHRFSDQYKVNKLSNLVVLCRSCHSEVEPPKEVYQ